MKTTFEEALATGIAQMEAGEYVKAADTFRTCMSLAPDNPEGYFY